VKSRSTIALDLAKNVIHVHVASDDGAVLARLKLPRKRLLVYLAAQPRCTVVMEACSGAHNWARQIQRLGHDVRLIAPNYVKPFVKRQKNDVADAEAICEAAQRPTMRFVAVKSEEQQASSLVFKIRDLIVRQRTQTINALRGHLEEFGVIAGAGPQQLGRLIAKLDAPTQTVPDYVREICKILICTIDEQSTKIRALELETSRRARRSPVAKRLMTIPGISSITATALEALAPPIETFSKGRDFAAWIGLTPRQHSTGGKPRLGKTSKMGQRDLRRLLVLGATAVVRWARQRGAPSGSWLARMLNKKPPKLIAVALANKMARIVWVIMSKGEVYRASAPAI